LIPRYEQALLISYLGEYPGTFRIGLTYDKESMTFKWLSGEELLFTNWGINEPSKATMTKTLTTFEIVIHSSFRYKY